MPLSRIVILGLALLVPLSSSYLHTDCFDPSVLNLGSSDSTPESNSQKVSELVSSFKKKLIDKKAPVAQEFFSKSFSRDKQTCIASSMNVYELPLKHPVFFEKIEETFGQLIDKLIELGEFRKIPIDHKSFMFEPLTKKVVFVDIVKILISEKLTVTKEEFKSQLIQDLKVALDGLKTQPKEEVEVITDKELKAELDSINVSYLDDAFEKTYVSSNSNERSKIRKIVSDLTPPVANGQSTSNLAFKVEQYRYLSNIKASINDKISQTITFDEKTNVLSMFVCYYYDQKYKECKFIGDNDAFKKGDVTLPIASGYRIDVDINSNSILKEESTVTDEGYSRNYIFNEAIYAHEIYLILVPESTPGLVSLKVDLEEIYVQTKYLSFFICVDRTKALKIKQFSKDSPSKTTSTLGKVSEAVTFPEGVEIAQVPSYMETIEDCERGLWNVKIQKTSTLIFNDKNVNSKTESSFTLVNQGYEIGSNLMTYCADPNPKLKIGVNKNPKTVKFGETTKTYLTNVILKNEKSSTESTYLCLGGDQQNGYFYSPHNVNFNDPTNKYQFFFPFNSHEEYFRNNTNVEWIYLSSVFMNDSIYPYHDMKYPEANTNNILVFVAKQKQTISGKEVVEFWVRVYTLDHETNVHEILSKEEVKLMEKNKEKAIEATREYNERYSYGIRSGSSKNENFQNNLEDLRKTKEKYNTIVNNAQNCSVLRFQTVPEKFELSKDKVFTFSENATVYYASDNVVIYSFDYTKPTNCNHYLIVPSIKSGEKLPPYQNDKKITLECIDKKSFLFFGDGEQHIPDQKQLPYGINRLSYQKHQANLKANENNPNK